jgi:hypothetical protein
VSTEKECYPTHKYLSNNRWENIIDSVMPFRYQAGEIRGAMYYTSQQLPHGPLTRHEAKLVVSHGKSFKDVIVQTYELTPKEM